MIKFFWVPKEVWYYVVFPIFGILIFYLIFNMFYSRKKGTYYYNYVVDYVYSLLGTIFCGLLFCLLLGYSIATLQILSTNNLIKLYPFLTILLIVLPIIPTIFLIYVISIFYKNFKRKQILDRNLEAKINGEKIYNLELKNENQDEIKSGNDKSILLQKDNELNEDYVNLEKKDNNNVQLDFESVNNLENSNFFDSRKEYENNYSFQDQQYHKLDEIQEEIKKTNSDDELNISKEFEDMTLNIEYENTNHYDSDYNPSPIKIKKDNNINDKLDN